jgi:hypothetical protein
MGLLNFIVSRTKLDISYINRDNKDILTSLTSRFLWSLH